MNFLGKVNFNGSPFVRSKVDSDHSLHTDMRVQQTSRVAQMVKDLPAKEGTRSDPWVGKIPWGRAWQPLELTEPTCGH